jgi:hypothetical protein
MERVYSGFRDTRVSLFQTSQAGYGQCVDLPRKRANYSLMEF